MLQAKTKEQKERISEILACTSICDGGDDGIHIDDWVSYDELAALVDYLRSINNPKKPLLLDLSIVAPNMLEPVETWLTYKKEKGQSYKPTGFKTFYKNLCKYSNNDHDTAMQIVELSMQNNYAGIFPLRNNNINNYGRETITDKIRRTVEEANQFSEQLRSRIGEQADVCNGDTDEAW